MTPSLMFQVCNMLVLPQWLLMIVAPNWHVTGWIVKSKLLPIILGIIYIWYIIGLFSAGSFASLGSLQGVQSLLSKDELTLAGWVHYLAFDLFVGAWEWQNAKTRHVPHYWLIPSLILTFLMGPVGLLFYLTIRLMYPPQIQAVL
ncbi:MAG: ABA4-like family protein [Chitinophagaceae bacterium]